MGQHLQEYHGNGDGICGNSNSKFKLYIYTAPIKVRLLTGASYKYARSNKTVFNNRLNCSHEVSSLFRLSGRLFHTVGAETRKLLGPKRTVRVREMISSPWTADRSPLWGYRGDRTVRVQAIEDWPHNQIIVRVRTCRPSRDRRPWPWRFKATWAGLLWLRVTRDRRSKVTLRPAKVVRRVTA